MKLTEKKCVACAPGSPALAASEAAKLLSEVPGWQIEADGKTLQRLFTLDSYWAGLGFTNAVAWIAQSENHHPDIQLLYKKVNVRFSTHSVNGLSENDFICAAKVGALIA